MVSRRTFLSLVAGSIAAPGLSAAQPASQKVALNANVGPDPRITTRMSRGRS
jgi:hypothetical protein